MSMPDDVSVYQSGSPMMVRPEIHDAVRRAICHADGLFVGEDRFTQVTLWDDRDFRVLVHHGFPQNGRPIHHAEEVSFHCSRGEMVYSNLSHHFDRHKNRVHKEFVIEEWQPEHWSPDQ